jgi:hypothetical protein
LSTVPTPSELRLALEKDEYLSIRNDPSAAARIVQSEACDRKQKIENFYLGIPAFRAEFVTFERLQLSDARLIAGLSPSPSFDWPMHSLLL